MNLLSITKKFATEDEAVEHLIRQRWPDGIRCVKCGSDRISRITSSGKTGKIRRLLECMACGNQFTATSGTLFHDSHLPLQKWFMAMALMCEAKKGISALQMCIRDSRRSVSKIIQEKPRAVRNLRERQTLPLHRQLSGCLLYTSIPSLVVFRRSNPDVEVRVDPRPRHN